MLNRAFRRHDLNTRELLHQHIDAEPMVAMAVRDVDAFELTARVKCFLNPVDEIVVLGLGDWCVDQDGVLGCMD